MHRSRLRNKFLRERTKESKFAYNKQRNISVRLLRKSERDYFENIVKKLGKEDVPDNESNLSHLDDPILKAIAKYENHPSILRIKNFMKENDLNFYFEFVDKPKNFKEINKLDGKKTCQEHDIPVKLIKLNKGLFSHFIYHNFNNSLFISNFPDILPAHILPKNKKNNKSDIEGYRPISIHLLFLRSMKDVCMTKCRNTLTKFFLNKNAVFAKVMILNIVY